MSDDALVEELIGRLSSGIIKLRFEGSPDSFYSISSPSKRRRAFASSLKTVETNRSQNGRGEIRDIFKSDCFRAFCTQVYKINHTLFNELDMKPVESFISLR